MLNREKYANEIIDIAARSRLALKNGRPVQCLDTPCAECDFHCPSGCATEAVCWLNAEYVESPVDWSKVAVDTPILVRDSEEGAWRKMIECMRNAAREQQGEKNSQADVAFIGREQNDMVEYKDEDAKALANALITLIRKCAENKTYELDCTITLGNMALDCCFMYEPHKDADLAK